MDTVTQFLLGASVGEAVLGKKVGNKAPLWGAVAGTIPDLDILITPFFPEVEALGIHRGLSHSVTFAVVTAPILGWLLFRLHRHTGARWRDWSWLAFWSIFTHPILDCFTMYGTQLFQPFSNYPVAIGSIFIIDPLYTVPLLLGLLVILFLRRESRSRRVINLSALGLSTFYLLVTWFVQWNVHQVFEASLRQENIKFNRFLVTPTAFNSILWMGIAEVEDRLYVGIYSLFDRDGKIQFRAIERNTGLIDGTLHEPALQRLLWFSRGFYTITEKNDALYFNDLRFGRSDMWLAEHGEYIFVFRLLPDPHDDSRVPDFRREGLSFRFSRELFQILWSRIKGYE